MLKKRITALGLAVVMSLSLAVTSFAVSDVTKPTNVRVTGKTTVPTINIEVPASAAVVLNPYAMKLKSDFSGELDPSGSQEKVISPVYAVINKSNIGVKVGVTATGVAAGEVKFAKESVAAVENKDKQVFVQVVMKAVSNADATTNLATQDLDPSSDKKVVLSTTAASLAAADQFDLVAGDGTDAAGSGDAAVVFQFQGDTSKTPTTPWSNKDTVSATLAFTFAPQDIT